MNAHFVLESDELNYAFIDKLRQMFHNKRVELSVSESDDTDYLCASPANKEKLLDSIANIRENQHLVPADPKLFE